MAVGKNLLKSKRSVIIGEEMNFEFVRHTRALGRKRILISSKDSGSRMDLSSQIQSKKQCGHSHRKAEESEKFPLEALPQDVLIRVLCGVDHDDLKNLFNVSKSIEEATVIAKRSHFAYSTPKKIRAFRTEIQFEDDEMEAPNAPKRKVKTRSFGKQLESISVALFPSLMEEEL